MNWYKIFLFKELKPFKQKNKTYSLLILLRIVSVLYNLATRRVMPREREPPLGLVRDAESQAPLQTTEPESALHQDSWVTCLQIKV